MAAQPFRLFQRLRLRLLCNWTLRLREGSALRLLTVLACSAVVWVALFAVSLEGFTFMQHRELPLAGDLVGILFDLFFLSLAGLLVFSSSLILYTSLFTSPEARFLLAGPIAADQVFAYKFIGTLTFSSWAFVLLGSPVLLAFGLVAAAPWRFYALLPVFFLGFVLLPGAIAGLIALLVANWFPQRPRQIALAALVVLGIAVGLWGYRLLMMAQEDFGTRNSVERLLGQLWLTRTSLTPNHWMTKGMQAAARGRFQDVAYYLALIWSNGLLAYLATAWAARRLYRRGYNRIITGGVRRRRRGGAWLDAALEKLLAGCHPQTRLLIVKDFRLFRRDPGQWGQVLLFTGLLVLYMLNVRRFQFQQLDEAYLNGVSMLNLMATALLLCAYTGRFIFPLLSLEGRRFWLLGLLPLRRERLLWGKFLFSAVGGLLIAESLIVLSDLVLGMSMTTLFLHVLTVAVLAVGLSGLSAGLGALLANFRETDPSKIAVGFGGTLNLVAGLLFLVAIVGLMAVPWHMVLLARGEVSLTESRLGPWLAAGVLAGILMGLLAVIVPLRLGARRLRQMEF